MELLTFILFHLYLFISRQGRGPASVDCQQRNACQVHCQWELQAPSIGIAHPHPHMNANMKRNMNLNPSDSCSSCSNAPLCTPITAPSPIASTFTSNVPARRRATNTHVSPAVPNRVHLPCFQRASRTSTGANSNQPPNAAQNGHSFSRSRTRPAHVFVS